MLYGNYYDCIGELKNRLRFNCIFSINKAAQYFPNFLAMKYYSYVSNNYICGFYFVPSDLNTLPDSVFFKSKALVSKCGSCFSLALITLFWLVMTLWNFGLPGLQFDEANHYAFIPGIQSEEAAQKIHFRLPDNYFDERDGIKRYPIVGGSVYNSPVLAYMGLPYFSIAEHSVESLRLFTSTIALISILAFAILLGRLFSWPAAVVSSLIIATDPSHIFLVRAQGAPIWPVLLFWALAANGVLTLVRHKQAPVWISLITGACIGWSVMAYFLGLFLALPLVLVAAIVLWKRPWHLIVFLTAGLVAYSPAIYAFISIYMENPALLHNFGTPDWAARPAVGIFSNENLLRLRNITIGAFGTYEFANSVTGRFTHGFPYFRMIAFASAFFVVIVVLFKQLGVNRHQRFFFWLIGGIFAIYFTAIFLLKATSFHHLLPVTVLAAVLVGSLFAVQGRIRFAAVLISAILALTNFFALNSAHDRLTETGGRGYYNESYSELTPVLTGPLKAYHPIFAGWGFHLQFLFLTEGKKDYSFIGQQQIDSIHHHLENHKKIAVVTSATQGDMIRQAFEVEQELSFGQRDGVELFIIFTIDSEQQVMK